MFLKELVTYQSLVQFTFFRINSYFVARREQGVNRSASDEQYTSYVDAQIKARVVKARSMEIVLYNHIQGRFHVKSRSGRTHRLNLHDQKCTCGKTLIYGFPCSHIIAVCQYLCVDFRLFVTPQIPGVRGQPVNLQKMRTSRITRHIHK